jgi:hypothetical protein
MSPKIALRDRTPVAATRALQPNGLSPHKWKGTNSITCPLALLAPLPSTHAARLLSARARIVSGQKSSEFLAGPHKVAPRDSSTPPLSPADRTPDFCPLERVFHSGQNSNRIQHPASSIWHRASVIRRSVVRNSAPAAHCPPHRLLSPDSCLLAPSAPVAPPFSPSRMVAWPPWQGFRPAGRERR